VAHVNATISSSGVLVDLDAAEAALLARAEVTSVAAVGIPDNYIGQALQLYVVLREGVAPSYDVRKTLTSVVAEAVGLRPRSLRFATAIPLDGDGRPAREVIEAVVLGRPTDGLDFDASTSLDAIANAS
jgi:acetyl-CoA synthetase